MTTETTISLPPCPLPGCEGGEHHYHDIDTYTIEEGHDCAWEAKINYRCYSQHQPRLPEPVSLPEITDEMVWRATNTYTGDNFMKEDMRAVLIEFRTELLARVTRWEPIERTQVRAGMRIRATSVWDDRIITRTGVAHHTNKDDSWLTERGRALTGWTNPTTYEVDPATIPADPDAELIEALREASWRIEHMGGHPDPLPGLPEARDLLNKLRELGWTVIRESEATA